MRINPDQAVFPFLADDPIYIEAVRTERAVREVLARLEPDIRSMVDHWVQDRIEDYVGNLVIDACSQLNLELGQLRSAFSRLRKAYQEDQDAADWWKNGVNPDDDENEDLFF